MKDVKQRPHQQHVKTNTSDNYFNKMKCCSDIAAVYGNQLNESSSQQR